MSLTLHQSLRYMNKDSIKSKCHAKVQIKSEIYKFSIGFFFIAAQKKQAMAFLCYWCPVNNTKHVRSA